MTTTTTEPTDRSRLATYDEDVLVVLRNRAKRVAQRVGLVEVEAEDVAQNALLALIQEKQVHSPTAWIITVALRGALGVIRRRVRHWELSQVAFVDCVHTGEICEMSDFLPDLSRRLERLGDVERDILLCRELNLCTLDDLSARTGLSVSTLRRRLGRARRLIRART